MGLSAKVWSFRLSDYLSHELWCSQDFFYFSLTILSILHKWSYYWLPMNFLKPYCFWTLFHSFVFHSFHFVFFSFFIWRVSIFFATPWVKGDYPCTSLTFFFSFHHTPNLGFWLKLTISIKPTIMRIKGVDQEDLVFIMFLSKNVKVQGVFKRCSHSQGRWKDRYISNWLTLFKIV